ncbi:hypothetical protein [Duganella violaceipulchra]|uniref:DUF1579 domain-containing protein n=1 Tax=Duganella violaceipulchra TaxID=2849652 RepID=A0AA41H605_9BURK|nr:hypothetical protein [Duganella violaceicalia]MBV6320954.1 hypothetical protein [Duganella violaceicalia]MCP2008329.1 hypothetical protein [Duganella violaceicalia]
MKPTQLMQLGRVWALTGVLAVLAAPAQAQARRDGAHDFDFARGAWHTHITRVLNPFDGGDKTETSDGTKTATPLWGGSGWIEELDVHGPEGNWKGATLFLYNQKSGQWSQSYIDREDAEVNGPEIGEFKDGRGEFYATVKRGGRTLLARGVWSDISADAHRYEISYSRDGGRSWAAVFKAYLTRLK